MKKRNNILICPLEWGLGHAGRMIPLAVKLKSMGQNVIIGSGDEHLEFFRREVPGLSYIHFPGFRMRYSKRQSQFTTILLKIPVMLWHFTREHFLVKRIIKENSLDIIISDSRPGLWNKNIISVFVFHMPRVPLPKGLRFLDGAGMAITRLIMNRYSFCFIPDLGGEENISGKLSHGMALPGNVRYIGILSRFTGLRDILPVATEPFYTVILSGPEPQRSILKNKLTGALGPTGKQTVILEGVPGSEEKTVKNENILTISHLPAVKMAALLKSSKVIITRSGYSTLMELVSIGRGAIIIPTPGQGEQEYLAEYMASTGWFSVCSQDKIEEIAEMHTPVDMVAEKINIESEHLLESALNELLKQGHKDVKASKTEEKS